MEIYHSILLPFTIGQFTQAVVLLYLVYCWKIIQQRMLVVNNFHIKIRYIYRYLLHVFKSCIGFMLLKCVNENNVYMFSYVSQKLCWFRAIKLFKCQKIYLECKIHNTAKKWAFTNNQVYSIQHTWYKVVWIAQMFYRFFSAIKSLQLLFNCSCTSYSNVFNHKELAEYSLILHSVLSELWEFGNKENTRKIRYYCDYLRLLLYS